MGYLSSDLLLSLAYNNQWPGWQANVVHHVTGLACWYLMTDGGFGHSIAVCATMTEITTPFINQRFFLDKANMKDGMLYVVNGLLMTLLWFLFRVLLFGWLGFRLFQMRESLLALPNLYLFAAVFSYGVGYALQLFWWNKIFKGAMKVLSGGNKKGDKKK